MNELNTNQLVYIWIVFVLSVVIFSFYKLLLQVFWKKEIIVYISRYSILMFVLVSLSLTIVFSLMFAVQSSRIEIIKHLKSE